MVLVATQVKRRRGTNDENDAFAGAEGEITVDLTNKELRVHDGSGKKGGFRVGFYSYTSNCIMEIPQNIKLELNAGTLTLKAGSKVYVPNGSGAFTEVTIANDISTVITTSADQYAIAVKSDGTQLRFTHLTTGTASGTNTPTSGYWTYYNVTDNKIYAIQNGVNIGTFSFPVCIVSTDGSQITSIDQVFNGIGYIGSHVFFLKGYSVLTPNGRNTDGTLANRRYTFSNCAVYTRNLSYAQCPLWVRYNGQISFSTGVGYDPITNQSGGGGGYAQVATAKLVSGAISNFVPKQPFRAVDYSDSEYIAHQGMPSNKYIDLTLGASGATYTAPADGYFVLTKSCDNTNQIITIFNLSNQLESKIRSGTTNGGYAVFVPCQKGDIVQVDYTFGGSTNYFRFIYANGSK